jgi:hypothetical protein
VRVTQLLVGPYKSFPVELIIIGPDPSKLYEISDMALEIVRSVETLAL